MARPCPQANVEAARAIPMQCPAQDGPCPCYRHCPFTCASVQAFFCPLWEETEPAMQFENMRHIQEMVSTAIPMQTLSSCFTKTEHPPSQIQHWHFFLLEIHISWGRTVLIGNVSLMLCLYMYLYKIIKKGETLPSQSENDPAMIENWKMAPAGRDAKSGRRGRYICAILFSWC